MRKPKPASPFGGFRKRTITAWGFSRAMASIAADAPTLYRVWVRHELDPGFREELMLAVSKVMDAANLGANTFDAMRSRLRGAPAQGSRILDEVLLSAAFCVALPPMLVFLSVSSKRSIREVTRRMMDYTGRPEARQRRNLGACR